MLGFKRRIARREIASLRQMECVHREIILYVDFAGVYMLFYEDGLADTSLLHIFILL